MPFQKAKNYPPHKKAECYFCGGTYSLQHICPAKGKTCSKCKKSNHFAKVCRSKAVNAVGNGAPESPSFTSELQNQEETEVFLYTIGKDSSSDEVFAEISVSRELKIKFKVDTGAQVNILPSQYLSKLSEKPKLSKATQRLTSYCGSSIPYLGVCSLSCSYKNGPIQSHVFYIVKSNTTPIIGLKTSKDLNLIKLVLNIEQSPESENVNVFKGIGKVETECEIHLKDNATPTVHPARKVPLAMKEKLKNELDRLESLDIIEKVSEPTDWVNAMVMVEKKDGTVRLCIDPVDLNKAIKRPHYPIPTFEDAVAEIDGAVIFSKLDARSGYWILPLSTRSSYLTTFSTIFGRYRWKRYPFGLVSAQDEFQRKMEEAFEGLKGIRILVDDILVYGKSRREHDERLTAVLNRAKETGIRFNKDKCEFAKDQVKYFGHIISKEGIKPDPEKIKAIRDMPNPKSKEELQTLLGMLNFLSKYIPDLSSKNKPLRDLTKATEFKWEAVHKSSMEEIKRSISDSLSFFEHDCKTLDLKVDASKHGLGAELSLKGKIFGFASRALSKTEQNYSQMEKELYAIVFGCKHFHHYIYGRKVFVTTDHRPLETILSRPLHDAPARLQRMMIQIQPYDLEVRYSPGAEIPIPDALSRLHLPDMDTQLQNDIEVYVHTVMKSLPVSDSKLEEIRHETRQDAQLATLTSLVHDGWPSKRQSCPMEVLAFWNIQHELSVHDGLLLKGQRIIIPHTLRTNILHQLHHAHLGIDKTKMRARMIVYWPKMNADIERFVQNCEICSKFAANNQKEPLRSSQIPSIPWQHLGIDLFEWNRACYLIISDYYSRFFEVEKLPSQTSSTIIEKMKTIFSRFGIPQLISSDNGPQLFSQEFKDFAQSWGISLKTSSPIYPRSNGLVEKSVQICKKILTKAKEAGTDPHIALLEYRNSPVDSYASPAQLLMSRQLRSILPSTYQQLKPRIVPTKDFMQHRLVEQNRQKSYYDKSAKQLPELQTGEKVFIQKMANSSWTKAKIISRHENPRSYVVETADGSRLRRNRTHISRRHFPTPTSPGTPTTRNKNNDTAYLDTSHAANPHIDSYPTEEAREIDQESHKEKAPLSQNSSPNIRPASPCHMEVTPLPSVSVNLPRTRSGRVIRPITRLDI